GRLCELADPEGLGLAAELAPGYEHDVHAIASVAVRGGGEVAGSALRVVVDAIRPVHTRLQEVQRRSVDSGGGEGARVVGEAAVRVIRDDVGGVGIDWDRRAQAHLLPPRSGLAAGRCRGEQNAGTGPELHPVRAGLTTSLVEANG